MFYFQWCDEKNDIQSYFNIIDDVYSVDGGRATPVDVARSLSIPFHWSKISPARYHWRRLVYSMMENLILAWNKVYSIME